MSGLPLVALLLAHAAIHGAYLGPRPPATAGGPEWPFELTSSWLLGPLGVDAPVARLIGMVLVALTLAGFAAAALAVLGFLPGSLWTAAVTVGALGSLGVLVLFFHPWLVIGIAIDVVLLWAVLVVGWQPSDLGA